MAPRPRSRPAARTAVVALPRRRRALLRPALPSRGSAAVAAAVAAAALAAYVGARESSVFAVREVQVTGAPPAVAQQVTGAARGFIGSSLVALDGGELLRRVRSVPTVADAELDRAFPNTLSIRVVPEQRAVVVRRGADAWLVARSGRVMTALARTRPPLPRVWLPATAAVRVGGRVSGPGARAVAALGPILGTRFVGSVQSATAEADGRVSLVLRSGLEVRLGDLDQLRLKLVVAQEIVRTLGATTARGGYVDVSLPQRPVATTNAQVGG